MAESEHEISRNSSCYRIQLLNEHAEYVQNFWNAQKLLRSVAGGFYNVVREAPRLAE